MQRNGIQHKRAGFTLAELLVTIALIGMMFVIALPALTDMAGGSRLDSAANAVHSAIKLARQYAVSHAQPTFLVFHDDQTSSDDNLAFRSFAVFTINIHTHSVDQSAGHYLTGWETLPSGIVFDPYSGGHTNVFQPTADFWKGAFSRNNQLYIESNDYIVIGFKPGGTSSADSRCLYLAEGAVNQGKPFITASGQGKQIQFTMLGKSRIRDFIYTEKNISHFAGHQ